MTPKDEIAAATKRLYDLRDDVSLYAEHWDGLFHEQLSGFPNEVAAFIKAMSPAVALVIADWLSEYEDIEFTEHGPLSDDLKAALDLARAINKAGGGR